MKRYLIIDGATQVPGTRLIPHTSFDSLARAKKFLMELEDESVFIKDRVDGKEWFYEDGRILEEDEVL